MRYMSKTSRHQQVQSCGTAHTGVRGRCTRAPRLSASPQLRSAQDTSQGIDQDSLAPPSQRVGEQRARERWPQVHRVLLRCAAPLPYRLAVYVLRFYRIPPRFRKFKAVAPYRGVTQVCGVRSTCDTTDERRHTRAEGVRRAARRWVSVTVCVWPTRLSRLGLSRDSRSRLSRLGGHTPRASARAHTPPLCAAALK